MNPLLDQNRNLKLIQVLRAIASVLVVFYHATENFREKLGQNFLGGFFEFGGSGVDIFFVLSGFIITYTSFRGLGQADKLTHFIRRRVVRIYPIYWVVIMIFLAAQFLLPSFYRSGYQASTFELISTFLLLPGHQMLNGVSWTLSFELFFYILFAIAFLIPGKRWIFFFSAAYILLLVLINGAADPFAHRNEWIRLAGSPLNTEFFLGVISVLFIHRISRQNALVLIITGSVLFVAGGLLSNNGYSVLPNNFHRVILFGIPSLLLLSGVVALELNKPVRVSRSILLLGEASYSLYLIHLPLVAATAVLIKKLPVSNNLLLQSVMFFSIVLICGGSVLFHQKIEKPLTDRLNRLFGNKDKRSQPKAIA
jgi:peptidoglycan/LPS O-acetylase OafA/YrhL